MALSQTLPQRLCLVPVVGHHWPKLRLTLSVLKAGGPSDQFVSIGGKTLIDGGGTKSGSPFSIGTP